MSGLTLTEHEDRYKIGLEISINPNEYKDNGIISFSQGSYAQAWPAAATVTCYANNSNTSTGGPDAGQRSQLRPETNAGKKER